MDNTIERIKQRIEARKWKITDDAFIPEIIGMQYANNMNDWCLEIINKELAKEPQECVWTKDIYKRMHTSCHHLTEEDIETTFCKYCGRKIKVNE